jgi:predicted signal transduction protein with EAL and GGDEF domain
MDTVARMGGDEFAVLLEDLAEDAGPETVAQRLLAALAAPFELDGRSMAVHASVGTVTSTIDTVESRDLLRDADIAMYTAKRNGKGRVERYEPAMHEAAMARLALVADLDRALAQGEFFVEYQPIVRMGSGEISGAEALVRWRHPERGTVSPAEFIPAAEETGMIVTLDRWVLRTAVTEAAAWRDRAGLSTATISVNVSGRHLLRRGLVAEVATLLVETGLAPSRLLLEFTESVLIEGSDATAATFAGLRALGVRLALDDFGTGYSSLSYLRGIPVDVLKIDGSFVRSAANGPDELALLRSIVDIGASLHLDVVAEGIEDQDQLDRVRGLGAVLGQGYFFSRPLPAERFAALVASAGKAPRSSAGRSGIAAAP